MKINKPKIKRQLEEANLSVFSEEVIDDTYFTDTKIPSNLLTIEFNGCHFKNVCFSRIPTSVSFYDCIFEACDFSNVTLDNASFMRCRFSNTKLMGLILSNVSMQDVSFSSCMFDYASFLESSITKCIFQNSSIKEVRFFKVKYHLVEFETCEIVRIENISTSLKDIDFSSCLLIGGTFSLPDLRGVILNSEQALEVTKLFGILIKDSI